MYSLLFYVPDARQLIKVWVGIFGLFCHLEEVVWVLFFNYQRGDSVSETWRASGNYQLRVNANNFCGTSPTKNLTVNIFDKPASFIVSGD